MQIFRSVTQHLTQHANPSVPKGFLQIANLKIGSFYIMPILYWLAIAAVLYVVSKRTTFGRHVFAVGSNIRTARLSGINVNKVKRRIYMLTGMLVAIAAIIQVSRIGSMDYASAGSGYEMDAIAAVIVGGTSMSGGKAPCGHRVRHADHRVMNNLLNLLGVDPFLREAFKGAIIIAAVLSLIFFHGLRGVGIGTVISAVLVGPIINIVNRVFTFQTASRRWPCPATGVTPDRPVATGPGMVTRNDRANCRCAPVRAPRSLARRRCAGIRCRRRAARCRVRIRGGPQQREQECVARGR